MSSSTKSKIRALGAKIERSDAYQSMSPMVHIVEYVSLTELKPGDMLIDLTGASDAPLIPEGHHTLGKYGLMLGMRNRLSLDM